MASALRPADTDPKVMLAEAYYRRDEFEKAAAALSGIDVGAKQLIVSQYPTLNVAKLQSFKGQTPYEVHGDGQSTRVKFLRTDPLPLVSVRVNGSDEVTFFIDTGGSEVALDTEFRASSAFRNSGRSRAPSPAASTEVQQGRIESLSLGDWTVRNLPVAMLPLRQLSQGLGVKRIDGSLGTTLFYHFLATLDFPNGELVLRRKDPASLTSSRHLRATASRSRSGLRATISWSAGAGWRRFHRSLLFVDTGLAGAGVKLAESVISEPESSSRKTKPPPGRAAAGR